MHNLASTFHNQRRWKEAEKLFIEVIEARKSVLGQKHPDTRISMDSLSKIYTEQAGAADKGKEPGI
jgi:Tetratricopeptide repeat